MTHARAGPTRTRCADRGRVGGPRVRDDLESGPAESSPSAFDRPGHDSLPRRVTTRRDGLSSSAHVGLIHLDAPGQSQRRSSRCGTCAASSTPSGSCQGLSPAEGSAPTGPALTPSSARRLEPHRQRRPGSVENCPRGHTRGHTDPATTITTPMHAGGRRPVANTSAPWANEAFRPTQPVQVVNAVII